MRTLVYAGLMSAIVFSVRSETYGSFQLSLSSNPSDLSALAPGDAVTFNVELSAIGSVPTIGELNVSFNYDGTILGPPSVVAGAGYIVDTSELDVLGITPTSFDVNFLTSGAGLTTTGDFFAVNFTVAGTGTGTINMASASGVTPEGDDLSGFADFILPGAPIDYTSSPAAVIPEASSILVWLGIVAVSGLIRISHGRRKTPNE